MNIGPEGYYYKELKGKAADEILEKINELKQEMDDYKTAMEDPNYVVDFAIDSRSTGLATTRACLERAIEAYKEVGGTYTPTQEELDAAAFQDSVADISMLTLMIGDVTSYMERRTIVLGDDAHMDVQHPLDDEQAKVRVELGDLYDSDDLVEMISNLYLGEWEDHYDQSKYDVKMPNETEWSLEVQYNDGRSSVTKMGVSAFPYNFDSLQELFGIEPSMDVWDTDDLSEEDKKFYDLNLKDIEEDENERFLLRMNNLTESLFGDEE